jgi:hypothetical protein
MKQIFNLWGHQRNFLVLPSSLAMSILFHAIHFIRGAVAGNIPHLSKHGRWAGDIAGDTAIRIVDIGGG